MEFFKKGSTYWIQIEVNDEEEAQKLFAWLYPDRAKTKVETFGCSLNAISWEDPWIKYKKFIEPLKEAFMRGEL